MIKLSYKSGILLMVFAFVLSACKNEEKTYSEAEIAAASLDLNDYFDEQFERDVAESPMMQTRLGRKTNYGQWDDISHLKYAEDLKKAKERLEYLEKIDVEALDEQTLLSYRLYKQQVKNEIEDYDFRFYNYPVNQMFGYHAELPAFLINMHRIDSVSDARAYISRVEAIPEVVDDVIANIKIREQNGIVPPTFVFDKVIEDSKNLLKGKPFKESRELSVLYGDFEAKISKLDLDENQQENLKKEIGEVLTKKFEPAYKKLIQELENQQKRSSSDAGAWKFPKGKDFYTRALKRSTTTDLTADKIHELGKKEVKRIHQEMREIMKKTNFDGSLQDFFEFMRTDEQFYYEGSEGRERYLKEATALINTMKTKLDNLFITQPEADINVKAVEPFRERSAGKAFYQQPAPDGSRPGIYYANLYDMKAMPTYQMEALAYHEGIPGHHMQLAIAQELEDIPEFRKYSSYTAYIEGWGLYSELLPKEIGFYNDPYSDFGRLAMELWRACRLVVDTGIHAKKWTRQEGIDYYKQNTPNAESDAVKMVERHIVMPGQATAYKVGMNKILELREMAKTKLEDKFNIKEFHEIILANGAMPLNILEERIKNYIEENK